MVHQFRVAIGQLCSSSNLQKNLKIVTQLISKAIDKDVKLILFPEATDFLSRNSAHSRYLASHTSKFISDLQNNIRMLVQQKSKKIDVSIGVHLPPSKLIDDSRTRNVLLYINHNGTIIDTYQKLHLFDVDIKNGPILKESQSVQAGMNLPNVIETPVGKLGTAICYDIRFPEMAAYLRSKGAQLLCYPSAFTMKTGVAHWETLGKARAIDNQCYVIMPGQQGKHNVYDDDWKDSTESGTKTVERQSWGHSMVINPWGEIVAKATESDEPQLVIADLDHELMNTVRQNMPLLSHMRKDIFYN
ncbi:similar to Saccharomyces cerevisiae YJL126W NIT2 Nit protein [Maudiozyma saulgeensis]|uniref:Similar to Saccharomyces cerevisiae YJL126W NIT2 Nit protein n=1 Tax=Maudiozyma saulgeensis TaxID=1789683 RepID=A0A1X7RC57_9SACH|nr:similar to Saccharomyces cerevisiae YJL126W NIT2 Nit protein [Kazachstania saulgeensis]